MKRRDEVLVGIVSTISLVMGLLGALWLARGGLQPGYSLYAKFVWGAGLRTGQPVRVVDDIMQCPLVHRLLQRQQIVVVRFRVFHQQRDVVGRFRVPDGAKGGVVNRRWQGAIPGSGCRNAGQKRNLNSCCPDY